nr:aldose 1-epimerase [Paenibacillus aceris]
MKTIVMENERIRLSVLVDKGTEIFEFLLKSRDLDFMWLTDNGIHNPNRYLPTSPDSQSTYIDYYIGGWQEIFPNGGVSSSYMGAQFGQHGEVAHMPWDYIIETDTPEMISVKFTVKPKKVPFELSKIFTLCANSTKVTIKEEVRNLSEVSLHYMWGQHMALGKPFLQPDCKISLPENIEVIADILDFPEDKTVRVKRGITHQWPLVEEPSGDMTDLSILPSQGTPSEIVYLTGFNETGWYQVENNKLGAAMRVEWDARVMPYLWYWQEFGHTSGYPWYGRHYNIGLEPFSSYPTHGLAEAIRNGTANLIHGEETQTFTMSAALLEI